MPNDEGYTSPLLWIAGLGAIGIGVYFLLARGRPPGEEGRPTTEVMPKPSIEPPASFPTLGAVATRLQEVGDLWRMGDLGPDETIRQLDDLAVAVADLRAAGRGDDPSAEDLFRRIDLLRQDVSDWMAITQPSV